METPQNPVAWFEIPVTDMARAIRFYNAVLGYNLTSQIFGPTSMAIFPHTQGYGSGGALVLNTMHYIPSTYGSLLYFGAPSGDLNHELSLVEKAGGKVLGAKKHISKEHGYMALILDSEGNRLALQSMK